MILIKMLASTSVLKANVPVDTVHFLNTHMYTLHCGDHKSTLCSLDLFLMGLVKSITRALILETFC